MEHAAEPALKGTPPSLQIVSNAPRKIVVDVNLKTLISVLNVKTVSYTTVVAMMFALRSPSPLVKNASLVLAPA